MKAFKKPPRLVKSVTNMLVSLLTGKLEPTWESFKILADKNLIQKLIKFDTDKVPRRVVNACWKYFADLNA